MRQLLGWIAVSASIGSSSGCASSQAVRYVYQDGDFGVVGMPENTDRWPTRYRHQADKLMDAHFPSGHEVVRAEEVVEGERTLKLEGSKTAEVAPALPAAVLKVAKLGRTASRSQSDTLKIKECRIIYRRSPGLEQPKGYADAALTPAQYVDPNAVDRRKSAQAEDGRDWKDPKEKATSANSAEKTRQSGQSDSSSWEI